MACVGLTFGDCSCHAGSAIIDPGGIDWGIDPNPWGDPGPIVGTDGQKHSKMEVIWNLPKGPSSASSPYFAPLPTLTNATLRFGTALPNLVSFEELMIAGGPCSGTIYPDNHTKLVLEVRRSSNDEQRLAIQIDGTPGYGVILGPHAPELTLTREFPVVGSGVMRVNLYIFGTPAVDLMLGARAYFA